MGIDIYALPMIELMHCGTHIFQGKLADMAQAGVHATLAPEDVGKVTKQQLGSDPQLDDDNLSTAGGNEAEKNSS
jgi:hypothetical protein